MVKGRRAQYREQAVDRKPALNSPIDGHTTLDPTLDRRAAINPTVDRDASVDSTFNGVETEHRQPPFDRLHTLDEFAQP